MIDLMKQFGKKYQVTMDPAWEVERDRKDDEKPWFYEIVGRNGTLYAFSQEQVALELTVKVGSRFTRETRFPFVIARYSSEGPTILFHPDYIQEALRWVRPRTRRHLTPEQRKAASERLQAYKFRARNAQQGSEISKITQEPVSLP